jgi:hypothetical protein
LAGPAGEQVAEQTSTAYRLAFCAGIYRLGIAPAARFHEQLREAATSPFLLVRIGNAPAATGRQASLDALRSFLHCTDRFACGFCEIWSVREAIYVETELEYRGPDGAPRRIPCSVIARTTMGFSTISGSTSTRRRFPTFNTLALIS